jgi:hypothetical protein
MFSFPSTSEPLTDHVQASLYYLAGTLIHKFINPINCDCIQQLVTNNDCPSIQKLSLFTKLKAFKENMLVFPSLAFYNYIYSCELEFRANENSFSSNSLNIPGHFFNIEHSPYLFPMFNFKKHRSMHVCNHVTKVTKIST